MGSSRSPRLLRHAVAFAVALALFTAAPSAPRAQAVRDPACNLYNQGEMCKQQKDCVWMLFFEKCTIQIWRLVDPTGGTGPVLPPELDG